MWTRCMRVGPHRKESPGTAFRGSLHDRIGARVRLGVRSELVVHLQAADDGLIVELEAAVLGIDSRTAEIDKQAFQPDGPISAQHVLDAATDGPAGLCLRT